LRAAELWRELEGPPRQVVDQVCLVPDVPSFLQAIAAWDEHHYFPVLIDDPAWTLPFVRAFRPARLVRFAAASDSAAADPERLWKAARDAVHLAWNAGPAVADAPSDGKVPERLGPTPPGLVLSHPESPALAGAVALAAGRFQPLLRLDPPRIDPQPEKPSKALRAAGFRDCLSLPQARWFVGLVESRAELLAGQQGTLGDRCDFITLAGDYPYRYRDEAAQATFRGEFALDDLVGRHLPPEGMSLDSACTRWAFTGRLLGDPAASVYRAMCSLFLQPDASILWDTYNGGDAWSDYGMTGARETFHRLWPSSPAPELRAGEGANLDAWHQAFDPVNRFGWIMINSSGGPRQFSIPGGTGCPADLPWGRPAAISIIHSFSASNPLDPSTLAGRWLEQGAFVYFGSMNEPFLNAFRPARLIAELLAEGVPLGAALREGEEEPFGRPWRLVYLGDPLFRFRVWPTEDPAPRIDSVMDESFVPIEKIASPSGSFSGTEARLAWCHEAALVELCQSSGKEADLVVTDASRTIRVEWRANLPAIDRTSLSPASRTALDVLVADSLLHAGETARLLDWLLALPPEACSPRTWRLLETAAMIRLHELSRGEALSRAIQLWDSVVRRPWPPGTVFPRWFTQRLAAMVKTSHSMDRRTYIERLSHTAQELAVRPQVFRHAPAIQAELKTLDGP
jgi:hypothetical protein